MTVRGTCGSRFYSETLFYCVFLGPSLGALPPIFAGKCLYLTGFSEREKERLQRLILAFDGDLAESERNEEITHVVVGSEREGLQVGAPPLLK